MSSELRSMIVRRTLIAVATGAVLAVAVGTVRVAADWRAAAAPLDAPPVSAQALQAQLADELARAQALSAEIDSLGGQINDLESVLATAGDRVGGDTVAAETLKSDLDVAKQQLTSLQKQLKAAQARLAAASAVKAKPQAAASGAGRETEHGDDD
jgi:peptidoglycan hydrolase CwlO-like protein